MKSEGKELLQTKVSSKSELSTVSIDPELSVLSPELTQDSLSSQGHISIVDRFAEPDYIMTQDLPENSDPSSLEAHHNPHSNNMVTEVASIVPQEDDGCGSGGDEFGSSSGSNQSSGNVEDKPEQYGTKQSVNKKDGPLASLVHPLEGEIGGGKPEFGLEQNGNSTVEHVDMMMSEDVPVGEEKPDESLHPTEQKKMKAGSGQVKNGCVLQKPDKVLPCPRCSSMDTKFCYYNNYNINQPRHFCKNCQRYWTAGGTLRNVPVGSGRRKNKNSLLRSSGNEMSEPGRLMSPPDLDMQRSQATAAVNRGMPAHSGGVDGMDSDSAVTAVAPAFIPRDNPEEMSHGLSSTAMHPNHPAVSYNSHPMGDVHMAPPWAGAAPPPPWGPPPSAYPPPYSYFGGGPWAYGYVQPPGAWPGVNPWAGAPPGVVGAQWGGPWGWNPSMGPMPMGKRGREGEDMGKENVPWVPKTLRIEESGEEDRRGSAWTRVGLAGGDGSTAGTGSGVVRPFPMKEMPPSAEVMQANPAAMARSMAFNES